MTADAIDKAIAQAEEPVQPEPAEVPAGATHLTVNVGLPGERVAQLTVPVGLTALDVFIITDALHQFLRDQPRLNPARARIILPG